MTTCPNCLQEVSQKNDHFWTACIKNMHSSGWRCKTAPREMMQLAEPASAPASRTPTIEKKIQRLFEYLAHVAPDAPRNSIDPYHVSYDGGYSFQDLREIRDSLAAAQAKLVETELERDTAIARAESKHGSWMSELKRLSETERERDDLKRKLAEAEAERDALCAAAPQYLRSFTHERDALLAEIAGLREDKERLDWLENHDKCYWVEIQSEPHGGHVYKGHPGISEIMIREAITAAIAQQKAGEGK